MDTVDSSLLTQVKNEVDVGTFLLQDKTKGIKGEAKFGDDFDDWSQQDQSEIREADEMETDCESDLSSEHNDHSLLYDEQCRPSKVDPIDANSQCKSLVTNTEAASGNMDEDVSAKHEHSGSFTGKVVVVESITDTDVSTNSGQMTQNQKGEKPHKCLECNCSFSRRCDLSRHRRDHWEGRLKICLICHKSFRARSFAAHLKTHSVSDNEPNNVTNTEMEPNDVTNTEMEPNNVTNTEMEPNNVTNTEMEPNNVTNTEMDPNNVTNIEMEPNNVTNTEMEPNNVTNTEMEPNNVTNTEMEPNNVTNTEMESEIFAPENSDQLTGMSCLKSQKMHKCSICISSFNRAKDLKRHVRAHNEGRLLSCLICRKPFRATSSAAHTRTNKPVCTKCSDLTVVNEERICEAEEVHRCLTCNKSFSQSSDFSLHMKTHNVSNLICPECLQPFSDSETLLTHMKTHNPEQQRNCSICKKSFTSTSGLESHIKSHTGERPYCCSICGKLFTAERYLTAHIRTHTGEKPYNCSVCEKSFAAAFSLKAHMLTHTGDKPNKCPFCSKSFALLSNLTSHIRTHTGEKPYSCSVCSKSFCRANQLKRHIRTHTGERPYNCTLCSMSFTTSDNLKKHTKTHQDIPAVV